MSHSPTELYGSLYIYQNTTALNTSGGTMTVQTGWTAGDALNTSLNGTNGTITINRSGEVMISYTVSIGSSSGGSIFYYMAAFANGTQLNTSYRGASCGNSWTAGLLEYSGDCIYNATYGDIIDFRLKPINGTDSSNRPVIYLANLNVVGL